MEWSASSLLWMVHDLVSLPFGKWLGEGAPLDEETWERLRQKLDFTEEAPELSEVATDVPTSFNFPLLMEVLRFAGIALIAVLLVIIVVRLIAKNKSGQKPLPDAGEVPFDAPHAETPIESLWRAFEERLGAENYREALRMLYQISLKKLATAGLVKAHPDKTNWEYVAELSEPEKAGRFSKMTLVYESHWYGDEVLSKQSFDAHRPVFMQFIEALPDEK